MNNSVISMGVIDEKTFTRECIIRCLRTLDERFRIEAFPTCDECLQTAEGQDLVLYHLREDPSQCSKHLSELVTNHRVVLFMKGTRRRRSAASRRTSCRSSTSSCRLRDRRRAQRSPEIRDGIKEFSEWPTIPQLYVNGQFVGGCDIVRDAARSGELEKLLGAGRGASRRRRRSP